MAVLGAFGSYVIDTSRLQFFFEDESQVRLRSDYDWFDFYRANGNASLSGNGWVITPDTYITYRATIKSDAKTVKGWGLATNAVTSSGATTASIRNAEWNYNNSTSCTFRYDSKYEGSGNAYVFLHLRWFRYNLTFNSNGGSDIQTQSNNCYTNSVALPAPTRTGYTFGGWTNNTFTTAITGTKTGSALGVTADGQTIALRAKWTPRSFTVTFNANGGSVSTSSRSVTYDSTYGDLPAPTRTGYSFDGWYTAASDGTEVKSSTKVSITANQTLYAHWTANTYTIKFNLNGGGSRGDMTATYGAWKSIAAPSRDGYVFAGWIANGHNTSVAQYSVTSGVQQPMNTSPFTVSATGGVGVINLNTGISGDSSTTLTAQWTAKQCTVTFNANGGSVSPTSKTVSYASTYGSLPTPTRAGFTFVGWFTSAGGNTQITESTQVAITSAQTLYAHWTANVYEIGYDNLFLFAEWAKNGKSGVCRTTGGTLTKDVVNGTLTLVNENSTSVAYTGYANSSTPSVNAGYYTFPVSANTEYRFSAMLDGSIHGSVYFTILFYNDITNYVNSYSTKTATATGAVTHDFTTPDNATHAQLRFGVSKFGDSATISAIKFVKHSPYAEVAEPFGKVYEYVEGGTYGTLASPTRTGYEFSGWFGGENGTGAQIMSSTANTAYSRTIYSKWTANTYPVTFNANGGTVSPSMTNETYASKYKLPTPTRTGYTFAGWWTAVNGGAQITTNTTVTITSSQTLYAHWTANAYTVTFNANGGNVSPSSKSVTYASTYGSLPAPTRTGYTFADIQYPGGDYGKPNAVCALDGENLHNKL